MENRTDSHAEIPEQAMAACVATALLQGDVCVSVFLPKLRLKACRTEQFYNWLTCAGFYKY